MLRAIPTPMEIKTETQGAKSDSLPPWPSEPPAATAGTAVSAVSSVTPVSDVRDGTDAPELELELGERESGLVLTVDPRVPALEEQIAGLERQRAADAEQIARMTADLEKLDALARVGEALRESSLVQIRRLAVLEREAEGAKTALAAATAERDELRTRMQGLEDELAAIREALVAADAGARAATQALEDVTRALSVVRPKG